MDKKTFAPELQTEENKPLFEYIAELESEVDTVNAVNEELSEKIDQLSSKKEDKVVDEKDQHRAKPVLPTDSFEVNGKKYKFNTPVFMYKGNRIESVNAMKDTAMVTELVENGIGVITEA